MLQILSSTFHALLYFKRHAINVFISFFNLELEQSDFFEIFVLNCDSIRLALMKCVTKPSRLLV